MTVKRQNDKVKSGRVKMANQKTTTIDLKTAELLFTKVQRMEKALAQIKSKILQLLPAKYGSDLWWEKSDEEAIEQIGLGKGTVINNKEELKRFLGI